MYRGSQVPVTKVAELSAVSSGCCVRCRVVAVTVEAEIGVGDENPVKCAEVVVGDETGCIAMTLFGEEITVLRPGKSFEAVNVTLTVFEGSLRLRVGRWGEIRLLEPGLTCDVDLQNNLSDLM